MDEKQGFNCSHQELLTASAIITRSYRDNLADFTDFKARYKVSVADDIDTLIFNIQLMPNDKARTLLHQAVMMDLMAKTPAWLNLFQRLKRYIADAWPARPLNPYYEAAGGNYYEASSNYNWEALRNLFNAMRNFITLYKTDLTNNENMPDSFELKIKDEQSVFVLMHDEFLAKKEEAGRLRNERTGAMNLLYKNVITICKDAQEMYPKESPLYNLFVFEDVLRNIAGYGQAGLSGLVLDSVTDEPLEGVTVLIYEKDRSDVTNAEGRFEMLAVAAGYYTVTFSKPGYQTLTVEDHEIKTSIVGRLNVKLVKDAAAE